VKPTLALIDTMVTDGYFGQDAQVTQVKAAWGADCHFHPR
jgi:hypothetical protein